MAEEGGCAVLYYFDARGMGELPRLMLAAAGITVTFCLTTPQLNVTMQI